MVTGKRREDDYRRMFFTYYRILLFADFTEEVEVYDSIDFGVFVIATVFILIVLMNLLISIIGDTHENVSANIKKTQGKQQC